MAKQGDSAFQNALRQFSRNAEQRVRDCGQFAFQEVTRSVVRGSELTGAPGQPVDTGFLRSSWIGRTIAPNVRELTTNVAYAPFIEDGGNDRGRFALRSEVGGFHSVKLTRAGWPAIVEFARRKALGPRA